MIQEIRIRLWRACQHEIDGRKISSYIRKIADSVIINYLNEARKERAVLKSSEKVYSDFHSSETETIVLECVDALLESRRMVVKMYLRGLTVPDIAQSLRWTKTKTYNLYIRGIRDLKMKLKDRGIHYDL